MSSYKMWSDKHHGWEDANPDTLVAGGYSVQDLACKGTNLVRVDSRFVAALNDLQKDYGKMPTVNSCCREILHNQTVGGNKKSLHLMYNPYHTSNGTMAIDFNVNGWTLVELTRLLEMLRSKLWSIGHGYTIDKGSCRGFVHGDRRVDLSMGQAEFTY